MAKVTLIIEDGADGTLSFNGETSAKDEVVSRANACAQFIAERFPDIVEQAMQSLVARLQAHAAENADPAANDAGTADAVEVV